MGKHDSQDSVRSVSGGAAWPEEAPDEMEAALLLANYLEGGLDEAESERVEAWLAADPDALDLLIASREALADTTDEAAPESLVARASGIVRPAPKLERSGWLERLFGGFGGKLQPIGVAAAVLLACAVGIGLGQSSFANLMAAQSLEVYGADLGLSGDDLL